MIPPLQEPQRIAIVHEWFTSMRGGEKCVEALCEVFPNAELFTLLHIEGSVSTTIEQMPIHTSFIQRLPFARHFYRHYLPLFPLAVQQFDLDGFDLVISSHHCVAKGVRTPRTALHVCYCHSPMRYIWNLYEEYFAKGRAGVATRAGMRLVKGYLRRWDVQAAARPHHFVANSQNVQHRIRDIYGRPSDVIYPPVDTSLFHLSRNNGGYYLVVSALVPYKRVDLAIEACSRIGERLIIVGDGPDAGRLQKLGGQTVEFVGWQPDEALADYYANCRAVLFPGEEDFGIVPLEAMASGKPVVAFARGGALETVLESPALTTGILFLEQTVDSLISAVRRLDTVEFDPETLRTFAMSFDREVFKRRMKEYVQEKWPQFPFRTR
jgi:glycosyltransferase involved in cell wall biosynthesis